MFLKYDRLSSYEPASKFLSLKLINNQVWLAGGAIRSAIAREPISDYDLFFSNSLTAGQTTLKLEDLGAEIIFKCPQGKLTTYKKDGMKIQCITEDFYSDMNILIETFDITACRYVTDGVTILTKYSSVRDTLKKNINLHVVTYPVATMKRVVKYSNKGYTLTNKAAKMFVQGIYDKGVQRKELNTRVYID